MATLRYSGIVSLDGCLADPTGSFDWAMPDEEVHAFFNDLERPVGTYLYGRRMYETMVFWESADTTDEPPVMQDYAALWRGADKVVYSTTLAEPASARTRIMRSFDPEAVRAFKRAAERPLSIGGAAIAAHALRAGLVDELHLVVVPIAVGGGTAFLPAGVRVPLTLLDERRFGNGMVHLHYAVGG